MLATDHNCRTTFFKDDGVNYKNVFLVFKLVDQSTMPYTYNKAQFDCVICTFVVVTVKSIISLDNVTVSEVEHILDTVCDKIPFFLTSQCHDFVHKYYNLFAQLIIAMADKGTICEAMRACKPNPMVNDIIIEAMGIKEMVVPVGKQITFYRRQENVKVIDCAFCKLIVKAAKEIVKKPFSKEETTNSLKKVCDKIPLRSGECYRFVDKYHDRFVELLVNKGSRGKVCQIMFLCSDGPTNSASNFNDISVFNFNKLEINSCGSCKIASSVIASILASADILEMIQNGLSDLCNKFPDILKNPCHSAIDTNWNDLVNMLKNFNSQKFCKTIRLCVWKEVSEIYDVGKDMCTPCKLVSNILKSIMENPDISTMIKDGINNLCGKMPDPLKNVCLSELKTHWQDFMNMLRTFNAEQFCRTTKMCTVWNEFPNVGKAGKCANCRIAATTFKAMLVLRPDVAETLRHAIIDTCSTIPPAAKFVCMSLMNGYWYKLLNNLRQYDPYLLCQKIKMCPYKIEIRVDIESNVYESCTMLGNVLKTVSENIHLTEELRNSLSHLCNRHVVKDLCNTKMQTNWEALLNILQKLNIDKFCRSIDKPVVAEVKLSTVLCKKII